jgi:Na+/melibiose symporter-like transporter
VLILDETPLARHLEHYRRIVAVAVKTLIYGAITLLLGILERLLEARHRVHNFDAAAQSVIAQASLYRFLAWVLGITLVFALYFALFEINERMGEGELWRLFFGSSKTGDASGRHSNITVGNRPS